MEKSIESTFQKKTQREHILLRPDSYVGSVEACTQPMWVVNEAGDLQLRDITFVPGLYKIFDEVLVNAADNKQRDPTMSKLDVVVDSSTGRISVWNNGASVPVVIHAEHDVYVPELIFGHLLTSSNFDDTEKKVTGGRNGYGAKLTNIFSTQFTVETNDGTRGLKFRQTFTNNMTDKTEPRVTKATSKKDYTCIEFVPDFAKFKMESLDEDTLGLFRKRVYDMAGIYGRALKVTFNSAEVPIKSFKDYVAAYQKALGVDESAYVYERLNERWEIAVGVSDGQFRQVSYVNAVCTTKGGQHVDAIVSVIASAVAEKASKANKKDKASAVKPFQVRNHISVFVNCLIENPAFDSQTKDTLTTVKKAFGSVPTLSEPLLKRIMKIGLVQRVSAWAKFKDSTDLVKASGTKKLNLKGIPKLDDANWAGGSRASKCTLILTEGDSAKTLAISGLAVVGRDAFGVFPLRGKFLNVRDCGKAKMMANAEVQALVDILGLRFGMEYTPENIDTLRYGSIMIMADQDHDGSHIKGLVINFIHAFWPSLVRLPGFLCEFITPIVKATSGSLPPVAFYTMPQYASWQAEPEHVRGWTVKYYKGLGTSSAAEAKEYFRDIARHKIDFAYEGSVSDEAIQLAFEKSRADDRKAWLLGVEEGTFVDYNVSAMPITEFINKELSLFSLADNIRSIPSIMDGLKPSQRKILFGCFRRNLQGEVKVAQLTGYVSEHAAYHHGEQSLAETIVGLAQDFVGSNNINLLEPVGQFGTRLMGGKDSASARYIFTKLSSVTRKLFVASDDALLKTLTEDGASIEPQWYAPVIPMVLVNGQSGIGTGWSTSIPPYNPVDLIHACREMIAGRPCPSMSPWFRGFKGTVTQKDETHYVTTGIAALDESGVLTVTELPVGTWTQAYKTFLDGLIGAKDSPSILSYSDCSTDTDVHFSIKVAPACLPALSASHDALLKGFRLEASFATTNMHVFDSAGKIQKFDSAQSIVQHYFDVRGDLYSKRHAHLIELLTDEHSRLDNKMRFVLMVVEGELKVAQPLHDLLRDIRAADFVVFDGDEEFDYLLSIPIRSLTLEKVERLRADRDAKLEELETLKAKTPSDLWLEDLAEVEACLRQDAASKDEAVSKQSNKRASSSLSAPPKKKRALKK